MFMVKIPAKIKNLLRRKEKPISTTERRSRRAIFSDELRGSEHRLNLYWNEIAQFLKLDLAYVWTDKVRFKFKFIRGETKKLAFILRKIHSYYRTSPDKYKLELYHIKSLLWEIDRLYSNEGKATAVKKIYQELKDLMGDVRYEEKLASKFTALRLQEQPTREFLFRELSGKNIIPNEQIEFDQDVLKSLEETKEEGLVVRDINNLKSYAGSLWTPKFYIKYKNAEYYISALFYDELYPGYFFLVFVKAAPNTKYYLNLFYLSNSQNMWRVSIGITLSALMVKSSHEYGVNLPNVLQAQLSEILQKFSSGAEHRRGLIIRLLPVAKRQYSAPHASLDFRMHTKVSKSQVLRQYPNWVEGEGGFLRLKVLEPEKIILLSGFEPDYSKVIDDFKSTSRLYGAVSGKIIQSKNSQLSYLFLNDDAGRIWLGNAELAFSPISKFGVPVEAPNLPESFFIPAFEYTAQIPKGYTGKDSRGSYYDATPYSNNIPIIQEFRKVFNIEKKY